MSNGQDDYQTDSYIEQSRPGYLARRRMQKQLKLKIKKEKKVKPMRDKIKTKPRGSILGAFSSFFTVLLVLALIAAGGWLGARQIFEVKNNVTTATLFQVAQGDNLNQIAERLETRKIISNKDFYKFLVSLEGNDKRLKAGDYNIPAQASMREIMNIFVSGQSVNYKLSFAEGLTTAQVLQKVKDAPLLTGEITLNPVEGSLYPDTYLFVNGTDRNKIISQMATAQTKFLTNLWETRAEGLPLKNIEEAVILASIVEKETGLAKERPEVAAVFVNRLKKKMRLQSDPTIIYGITKGAFKLDRSLRKSEIKAKTAYNTYVIKGLPPTPISNPGKASILAVLNPAKVDYLFFVADGTGGHVFAKSYKQHQKNVKKWRAIEKKNKK